MTQARELVQSPEAGVCLLFGGQEDSVAADWEREGGENPRRRRAWTTETSPLSLRSLPSPFSSLFLLETKSCCVVQLARDPPASDSQVAGTISINLCPRHFSYLTVHIWLLGMW